MTARRLFSRTAPFMWGKLLLGLVMVLIAAALLAGFMALGWLFGTIGMVIAAIAWFAVVRLVWYFIMHYVGYLLKAGHVAVIAEACRTGKIPSGQVSYGKDRVRERFITTSVYFLVDKLVDGAVRDVQRNIGKLGNRLDFVPGMEAITGMAQFFVKISLGYIDECCLGWTFYNKEQNVFKSAADGVVLYTQNWKPLLKNAAWTMIKVILLTVVVALMIFVPVGVLFRIMEWNLILALLVAIFIAWVVKFAVMDSYIMIRMMSSYMEVAPNTPIAFDLYGKLCRLSKKFKELFDKGEEEGGPTTGRQPGGYGQGAQPGQWNRPAGQQAGPRPQTQGQQPGQWNRPAGQQAGPRPQMQGGYAQGQHAPRPQMQGQQAARPAFCGQCGARNDRGAKFCGDCGARL